MKNTDNKKKIVFGQIMQYTICVCIGDFLLTSQIRGTIK